MDIGAYRVWLETYVLEAMKNSDGSNSGISQYLHTIKVPRFLAKNRFERQKALKEACLAFDEHRHWPVEIVLSHLGIDKRS